MTLRIFAALPPAGRDRKLLVGGPKGRGQRNTGFVRQKPEQEGRNHLPRPGRNPGRNGRFRPANLGPAGRN